MNTDKTHTKKSIAESKMSRGIECKATEKFKFNKNKKNKKRLQKRKLKFFVTYLVLLLLDKILRDSKVLEAAGRFNVDAVDNSSFSREPVRGFPVLLETAFSTLVTVLFPLFLMRSWCSIIVLLAFDDLVTFSCFACFSYINLGSAIGTNPPLWARGNGTNPPLWISGSVGGKDL